MSKLLVTVFMILWCSVVMAGGKNDCTKEEASKAESESAYLTTWKDVYRSYQRFRHCDDGAISEGYDHSIAKILSSKSPKLDELYKLTKVNVEFEKFITKHVSGTVPIDDLEKIRINLSQKCPPKYKSLCEKLMPAVTEVK